MRNLLKQDIENIKESYRRFSCFQDKEEGNMILLAFPSEVNRGRYSEFLFSTYNGNLEQPRILGWYNAKQTLMDIFSQLKYSGILAGYNGLSCDNDNIDNIDNIVKQISLKEITEKIETETA